jgi:hypothetical protein
MVPELRQEAILASVRSRDISYIKYLAEELNKQYRLESLDIIFVLKEILMLRIFMY